MNLQEFGRRLKIVQIFYGPKVRKVNGMFTMDFKHT